MRSLQDIVNAAKEKTDTEGERNKQVRDDIAISLTSLGKPMSLQTWMQMMEQSMDLLAAETIRMIMADMPQEQVDEQAENYVDYIRTQRAILLYKLVEETENNPVSKLLVPK